uniref:CCHC-type domain-containing protein n=1 Tax=Biomphalaria glabrata TaxID=6526 RepID=A0A2C9LBJ4_BIOGL
MQKLRILSKDCNFKAVTAEQHREEAIRDTFINGLMSNSIRKRLLEKTVLSLKDAFEEARLLEHAYQHSLQYESSQPETNCAVTTLTDSSASPLPNVTIPQSASNSHTHEENALASKCYFCGRVKHPRSQCPAREVTCNQCFKKGHFQRVCKSRSSTVSAIATVQPLNLNKSTIPICINNVPLKALVDTGRSESYISTHIAKKHKWQTRSSGNRIFMASTHVSRITQGHIYANIRLKNERYEGVRLSLLDNLCSAVILGLDFISLHQNLFIPFDGQKPSLCLSTLQPSKVEAPSLFSNLSPNCTPVATRSRRYSVPDRKFIEKEIQQLIKDEIIEPSKSPWRAQVLVTTNDRHKKRMVVDYRQTINRFTLLDAYHMPRIDELAEKISQFSVYSTLDLKSA